MIYGNRSLKSMQLLLRSFDNMKQQNGGHAKFSCRFHSDSD